MVSHSKKKKKKKTNKKKRIFTKPQAIKTKSNKGMNQIDTSTRG